MATTTKSKTAPATTAAATACSFDKIKVGERFSMTDYFTVVSVDKTNESMIVKNASGNTLTIKGKELIEQSLLSNQQFSSKVAVGKNEMAERLLSAGDKIFTVTFEKQDGSKRVLTGHLISGEPNLGRSNVIDLEITKGNALRQVDHRTISSLVINGVCYTSK
jgi:hypothetical protein